MKLERIQIFPIKSLDPVVLDEVKITDGLTLENDRRWAIHRKSDGRTVNGKKYPAVHQLRSEFDLNNKTVALGIGDASKENFLLEGDYTQLNAFLSEYFKEEVHVLENTSTGFPDHNGGNVGASLVSNQTFQLVGEWFDLDPEEVNRRMRMNFIINSEYAFQEDELMGVDKQHPKPFFINNVQLNGYKPCERCPVPTRDSYTGEVVKGFQKKFLQNRLATQPDLLSNQIYAHAYMCGIVLNIPSASAGKVISSQFELTV
ncbi:MOSC N-terminal beta barrel domain-containing protein [Flammeovirga agarivorans]|uniref:MOSC domain-containing protein n=1 Tax=Flammeovirga agarivorans TaxID=2726742 RepID=A0A7X8XWE0_9BACT|nr:MOSC N-terminal beta barrel domain-containing protein [Flammeovirga agarivorans]NLR92161.1 MOSC domain-containing protein [Flammeovirga agarivorans]